MLRSMRIGTVMQLLFGAALLILIGVLGTSMWSSVEKRENAERVVEVTKTGEAVFSALRSLRVERGTLTLALAADPPGTEDTRRTVAGLRRDAAPAMAKLIALCKDITCPGDDALARIEASYAALQESRKVADSDLLVPLAQRTPDSSKKWRAASSAVVDKLAALSDALSAEIRLVDPAISEAMEMKEMSWIFRDKMGVARNHYGDAITGGTMTPALQVKIAGLEGAGMSAWKVEEQLMAGPGIPKRLADSFARAKEAYFGDYKSELAAIRAATLAGKPSPVTLDQLVSDSNKVLDILIDVPAQALGAASDHAEDAAAAATYDLVVHTALLLVALALGVGGLLVIKTRLVGPVGGIVEAMLTVARGDLSVEIPYRDRGDEVGALAGALAVFKENAVERARLAEDQQREQAEKLRRQQAVEAAILEFDSAARQGLEAFNAAAQQMSQTAAGMSSNAEATNRQAAAVSSASVQMAANVETVAVATEELSSSIGEIGRQVGQSTEVAARAVEEAQRTDGTVGDLASAAQKIGDVLKIIQDIAAQTSLLALNATIEAARAGEAGKGFAVVASEVKTLATQTSRATEEIAQQINSIQGVAGDAVEAIRSIGRTIGEINDVATAIAAAVEEQGAATQEIARNVQEASQGVQDVSSNIAGVNRSAEETGGAASHVIQAATELGRQAETLRGAVDSFLGRIRAA